MLLNTVKCICKIIKKFIYILLLVVAIFYSTLPVCGRHHRNKIQDNKLTEKICVNVHNTLKARHKGCFLRPDSGPCRADIVQWYYDVREDRCFRFFWGGCQGNGNKFETKEDCKNYCKLDIKNIKAKRPEFCNFPFDYGTCFGFFYRWGWDSIDGSCKRRLYSGCGGNQNNFQNRQECMKTCISSPNNTLQKFYNKFTTCVPLRIVDLQ